MSAWPEAVWLKQQVANLLDIKDLQQDIKTLEDQLDNFINNEFFTIIIPESDFTQFEVRSYEDVTQDPFNINFKNIIKLNSATVFLTDDTNKNNIDLTLRKKYFDIGKILPVSDLTDTFWQKKGIGTKECIIPDALLTDIQERQQHNIYNIGFYFTPVDILYNKIEFNFISDNYIQILLYNSVTEGWEALYDNSIQDFDTYKGWNPYFINSNINIVSGSDVTNLPLISWFCYNWKIQ